MENMKLVIKNDDLNLIMQSEKIIGFDRVKSAYELVTSKSIDVPHKVPLVKQDQVDEKTDEVKVDLQCPFCGHTSFEKVKPYFKFIKCPACGKGLFLSWINGNPNEKDEHGCSFKASTEFRHRSYDDHDKNAKSLSEYEKMFKENDDPHVPDSTNTIAEIVEYLDEQNINHQGVTLKGKLLDLVK